MFTRNAILTTPNFSSDKIDGRRLYNIDGHFYPSVTTILDETKDKQFLDKWKARLISEGKDPEAEKQRAAERGDALHKMIEDYVGGIQGRTYAPQTKMLFNQIRLQLNQIQIIHEVEKVLYSHRLKLAGRCDMIATLDNAYTIVDFKTSTRNKKAEWIEDYYIQCCAYAFMCYEMSGIFPKRYAIFMVSEESGCQIFKGSTAQYYDKLVTRRNAYDGLVS